MLLFLHDRIIMQSFSIRKAEQLLWTQDETAEADTLMMTIQSISFDKENSGWQQLKELMQSKSTACVNISGEVQVGVVGSRAFSGKSIRAELAVSAERTNYVNDWYKTTLIRHLKENGKD
jgi:hypothetical protein